MKLTILVLGAPNDENGNLGIIALDRLNCAYNIYKVNNNSSILCTGGFGQHFNTTKLPHAYYAQKYLINQGVKKSDLLEPPVTSNTVDDFKMSMPQVYNENPDVLVIITSDFHMERAKILHDIILNYKNVIFIPAKSSLTKEELIRLQAHEEKAIKELKSNNYKIY